MQGTPKVDGSPLRPVRMETVSAKYPVDAKALLRVIQARRGDDEISETVRFALDRLIREHFPDFTRAA